MPCSRLHGLDDGLLLAALGKVVDAVAEEPHDVSLCGLLQQRSGGLLPRAKAATSHMASCYLIAGALAGRENAPRTARISTKMTCARPDTADFRPEIGRARDHRGFMDENGPCLAITAD